MTFLESDSDYADLAVSGVFLEYVVIYGVRAEKRALSFLRIAFSPSARLVLARENPSAKFRIQCAPCEAINFSEQSVEGLAFNDHAARAGLAPALLEQPDRLDTEYFVTFSFPRDAPPRAAFGLRPGPEAIDSFYYLPPRPLAPNPAFNKVLLSRRYLFVFNEKTRVNGTSFFHLGADAAATLRCREEQVSLAQNTFIEKSN